MNAFFRMFFSIYMLCSFVTTAQPVSSTTANVGAVAGGIGAGIVGAGAGFVAATLLGNRSGSQTGKAVCMAVGAAIAGGVVWYFLNKHLQCLTPAHRIACAEKIVYEIVRDDLVAHDFSLDALDVDQARYKLSGFLRTLEDTRHNLREVKKEVSDGDPVRYMSYAGTCDSLCEKIAGLISVIEPRETLTAIEVVRRATHKIANEEDSISDSDMSVPLAYSKWPLVEAWNKLGKLAKELENQQRSLFAIKNKIPNNQARYSGYAEKCELLLQEIAHLKNVINLRIGNIFFNKNFNTQFVLYNQHLENQRLQNELECERSLRRQAEARAQRVENNFTYAVTADGRLKRPQYLFI
jgi:hypothetical protein